MRIHLILTLLLMSGCADLNVGPGPSSIEDIYTRSIQSVPGAGKALYTLPIEWSPGVTKGRSISSFSSSDPIPARLFITDKGFMITVYDIPTNKYLVRINADYSKILWLSGEEWGMGRIINFQIGTSVNSMTLFGEDDISSDDVFKHLTSRGLPQQ